ncbi:MAG TPA: tRNA (guanosine(37)-N1)-methyltransferase TrmD, partial [Ktedonobacterales bacterium]
MRFDIFTLFPEMLRSPLDESIIARARERGLVEINAWNPRDVTTDRHHVVDDYPYGGGAG